MTFKRNIRTALAVGLFGLLGLATNAPAADTPTVIPANVNDAGIDPARGKNHVWLTDDADRRVGKLLVVMGGGGGLNLPQDWSELGAEGGRLGYHTIVLAYSNAVPIAAPAGCGPNLEPPASPENCAFNARKEILYGDGDDPSPVIAVNPANSIENRLTKVLLHLEADSPEQDWSQFLDRSSGEPEPKWSETVVSGQSLGAGQAVLIGMEHLVHRVVAFAGFTDAKHGWVAPGVTPTNRYFALIHQRDDFFERACFAYRPLGLAQSCPLLDFTLAENRKPPFGMPLLVFDLEPDSTPPSAVNDPEHTSTTRDGWIAKEADGTTPSQKLLNAWRSVLGDSDADTRLDAVDNCPSTAPPDQTDTDGDGVGDVCGFFAPVDNGAVLNLVKSGSTVPVKFSLSGDQGLGVVLVGSPSSQPIACDTQAPLDVVEETVSPGASTLSYDALADRYRYGWKTDAAWSGTCRQLTVRTVDGGTHHASFMLK